MPQEVNSIALLKSQQTFQQSFYGSVGHPGAQFNSFVEISTDFSTEFLVLQGVPHYYKNSVEKSVEKSVEISTKLLN